MGVLVFLVLVILCLVCSCIGQRFVPADNYMIDCGSNFNTSMGGGIVYVADDQNSRMLSTPRPILFANTSNTNPISSPLGPGIYRTARLFTGDSTYTLPISNPGRHWIRFHFYPFVFQNYNLSNATFSVTAQQFTLLKDFQQSSGSVVKEFSVNVTGDSLVIRLSPRYGSFAFLSALEVVSVPDDLIADIAVNISPRRTFHGLSGQALETVHRVNMGGQFVAPTNDTLGRTWVTDDGFLLSTNLVNPVSNPGAVKYDEGYANENSAPIAVYGTAAEMSRVDVTDARFNMTWEFDVDPEFEYLIRLHFCDIDSALNQLIFNVYVASQMVSENFDISKETNNLLGTPLFLDYIAKSNQMRKLSVSIGPSSDPLVDPDGILNGLEIMKINNSAGSLDSGPSVLNPAHKKSKMKAGVIAGAIAGACVLIAMGIFICLMCRRRRLQTQTSKTWVPFMANGGVHSQSMASKFSNGTHATTASNFGYQVPFKELQEATDNFNESWVVGVGGFGKVYKGVFRDGRKVAVKRGNPQSQQGLAEFRTEIELLSQFRHRHLVSLIGYCDERNEMILIYEYMEKGTLKSHLYGSEFPSLDWKQRLEICIGSARGLHYLHTGYAKAIIHRDVKSANILLDENLMAKVADFGLSKTGPDIDQTHVSTAVKGSFGYLDPEYFRRQQLTEKSDVYSFGVVLFEVLCARPVIDPSLPREKVNLGEWAMKFQTTGNLEQIIDPKLAGIIRPDSLRKFGETAEKCLAEYGVDRPSMADVLWNLEYALQLQEAGNQSDPSENSTNQIGDISPLVSNASFVETSAMNDQFSSVDDLSGTSMSKVFSQLIKAEGR